MPPLVAERTRVFGVDGDGIVSMAVVVVVDLVWRLTFFVSVFFSSLPVLVQGWLGGGEEESRV